MRRKRRIGWQKFSYFFAMVPLDAPASHRRMIHWTPGLGYSPGLPGARRVVAPQLARRYEWMLCTPTVKRKRPMKLEIFVPSI